MSLFLGGLVSTRIGAITDGTTGFFEGALVWVVSVLLMLYLATSGIGMLAGGTLRLVGGAAQAAAQAAPEQAQQQAGDMAAQAKDKIGQAVESAKSGALQQKAEEMKPAAQQRLVRSLVATEIRTREGIEVTDQEVEEELNSLAAGATDGGANLRRLFESDAGRRSLRSSILTRKTLERLVETVTQADRAPAPETKEGPPANG